MLRLFRARAERYARELSDTKGANAKRKLLSQAPSRGSGGNDAQDRDTQQQQQQQEHRAVYICPIKALGYEKHQQWTAKFPFLRVVIETGDQEKDGVETMQTIMNANVLVTTPERWDSITRRWKEATVLAFVASVKLILLDEVHSVAEDRGAALEAVVNRMKTIKATMQQMRDRVQQLAEQSVVRFVAISATLPNVDDMAAWLHVDAQNVFTFPESTRPVPLHVRVLAFPPASRSCFAFDRFLSFKLFGVVKAYSDGRPTLVFCASRKETVSSASLLCDELKRVASREGREDLLADPTADAMRLSEKATDKQLRGMLRFGIAFHHAAMNPHDRRLVEDMFRMQYVSCICTTTTLAMGVNLPARLVVIKGTTFFKNGTREDLPMSEMMQMCGRAGRPGLDTHGVAVILTSDDKTRLYERLERGECAASIVESRLHLHMVEHVNAEVALRTIHNVAMGIDWLKTTLFWIRLRKNPRYYGLKFHTIADEKHFDRESYASQLMTEMLKALQDEHCVTLSRLQRTTDAADPESELCATNGDEEQNSLPRSAVATRAADPFDSEESEWELQQPRSRAVISTRTGRAMARFYVDFDTVCTFNEYIRARSARMQENSSTSSVQNDGRFGGADSAPSLTSAIAGKEQKNAAGDAALALDRTNPSNDDALPPPPHAIQKVHRFTVRDVLEVLSRASEFNECRLRLGDKKSLNEINKKVRFPLNSGNRGGRDVRETWHKVFLMIQSQLSATAITLEDFSLRNDVLRMWNSLPRLAKFASSYADDVGSFSYTRVTILLLRSIERKIWWDDPDLIKQLLGTAEGVTRALRNSGIRTFTDVLRTAPRKLEVLCGKPAPFGTDLHRKCAAVPRLSLKVRGRWNPEAQDQNQDSTSRGFPEIVVLTSKPPFTAAPALSSDACPQEAAPPSKDATEPLPREESSSSSSYYYFTLLAGIVDTDEIVLQRRFTVQCDRSGKVVMVNRALTGVRHSSKESGPDEEEEIHSFRIPTTLFTRSSFHVCESSHRTNTWIRVHLFCERIIGVDASLTLQFIPSDGIFTTSTSNALADVATGVREADREEDDAAAEAAAASLAANAAVQTRNHGEQKSCTKRQRSNSRKASAGKPSKSPKRQKADSQAKTQEDCEGPEKKKRTEFDKLLRDLRWVEEGTSKTPPLSPKHSKLSSTTTTANRTTEDRTEKTGSPAASQQSSPSITLLKTGNASLLTVGSTAPQSPCAAPPRAASDVHVTLGDGEAASRVVAANSRNDSNESPQHVSAATDGSASPPSSPVPVQKVERTPRPVSKPNETANSSQMFQQATSDKSAKNPSAFLMQKEKLLRKLTEQDTEAANRAVPAHNERSTAEAASLNRAGVWDPREMNSLPSSYSVPHAHGSIWISNTPPAKPVQIRPMGSPPAIPPPGAYRVMHDTVPPTRTSSLVHSAPQQQQHSTPYSTRPHFDPYAESSASWYGCEVSPMSRRMGNERMGPPTLLNSLDRRRDMVAHPNPFDYGVPPMRSNSFSGFEDAQYHRATTTSTLPLPRYNNRSGGTHDSRQSWYNTNSEEDPLRFDQPPPPDGSRNYYNSYTSNVHSYRGYTPETMPAFSHHGSHREFNSVYVPHSGGGGGAYAASLPQSPAPATHLRREEPLLDGTPACDSDYNAGTWQRDLTRDSQTRYGFTINIGSNHAADGSARRSRKPQRRGAQPQPPWDDGLTASAPYYSGSSSSWLPTPGAAQMVGYDGAGPEIPQWPARPDKSHPYVRPQRRTALPDMFHIWQSSNSSRQQEQEPHPQPINYDSTHSTSHARFFHDLNRNAHSMSQPYWFPR